MNIFDAYRCGQDQDLEPEAEQPKTIQSNQKYLVMTKDGVMKKVDAGGVGSSSIMARYSFSSTSSSSEGSCDNYDTTYCHGPEELHRCKRYLHGLVGGEDDDEDKSSDC